MDTKDFSYSLPDSLIAQTPIAQRDMSRLMLLNKKTGEVGHDIFKNIVNHISTGDCLVLNETKDIPAREFGVMKDTGAIDEFLLLNRIEKDIWEVI